MSGFEFKEKVNVIRRAEDSFASFFEAANGSSQVFV